MEETENLRGTTRNHKDKIWKVRRIQERCAWADSSKGNTQSHILESAFYSGSLRPQGLKVKGIPRKGGQTTVDKEQKSRHSQEQFQG